MNPPGVLRKVLRVFRSGIFWSLLLFGSVVLIILLGIENVSATVTLQQQQMLADSVRRNAVQCYSIEGSYPPDLNYLEVNYGLYYDKEKYVVHYQSLGSNLLPQISVFVLEETEE